MATWTNIGDTFLEPGKPVRSVDGLALRDNPIAISEGASGAPKVRTAALQPPAAGSTSIVMRVQEASRATAAEVYLDAGFHNRESDSRHLGVVALVPGVIRLYVQHRSTGTANTATVRVLKNGSQVTSWTDSSSTFQTRTVDVSVATGDAIIFQQKADGATNQSEWRNLRVYSANPDMAVA